MSSAVLVQASISALVPKSEQLKLAEMWLNRFRSCVSIFLTLDWIELLYWPGAVGA